MEGAIQVSTKEMSIVANQQPADKAYQVSEPDELVQASPYANVPTDKLILQLGAADLQSILEEAIEARVEARLAQARKQNSGDKLEPFGSMMSVGEGGQHEEPHPLTVTAAQVNDVAQNVDSNVDFKPLAGDMTLTDILSDDEEEELDAMPLRNHDELTRCFECKRKHMTPNGLFMHLTQMHPKSEQLKRLKSTTWCPMCIVNCRHWYNMAMHVCEIHGQRSWWLEDEEGDVEVSTGDDVTPNGFRPETPKQSRGRVRQVSMVEYTDPDEINFQDTLQQKETSPFYTTGDAVSQGQNQILRKSSFGGFFSEAIKEQSAELWDDEMKSLDDRMQQIMDSRQSEDIE
eukprot:TRINITY_DN455_c0_g2_i7.p1 TRINITY_DN455_c0_g2~~TRINITY_DN455_c0_g2_i7.p1  ORF type:complete len:345 (-),score=70.23 TRINITY_DN455_c0_g2_i7:1423-2457(-)